MKLNSNLQKALNQIEKLFNVIEYGTKRLLNRLFVP